MRSTRPTLRSLIATLAAVSLVAACSDDDGEVPDAIDIEDTAEAPTTTGAPEPSATTPPDTAQDVPPETTDTAETATDTDDPATTILQPRVGTWVVGDDGVIEIEVDFEVEGPFPT